MKRRDFFKCVTGFVTGIFASFVKPKTICRPKSGPPGPTEISVPKNNEWRMTTFTHSCYDGHTEFAHYEEGKIIKRMSWSRALSNEEIAQLYRDPCCLFYYSLT